MTSPNDHVAIAHQRAALTGRPAVVIGERGTGKLRAVQRVLAAGGHTPELLSAAEVAPAIIFEHPHARPRIVRSAQLFDPVQLRRVAERLEAGERLPSPHVFIFTLECGAEPIPELLEVCAGSTVHVPPLRERVHEIPDLVVAFVDELNAESAAVEYRIADGFTHVLAAQPYPGNIRELRAVVHLCANDATLRGETRLDHRAAAGGLERWNGLSAARNGGCVDVDSDRTADVLVFPPVLPTMRAIRRQLVNEALARSGGNQSEAARLLGLTPSAVNKYLAE
jgi:transcriptional regulator with AAA-type ATPase domain